MATNLTKILQKTLASMERAQDLGRQQEQAMKELRRNLALTICELEMAKAARSSDAAPSNLIPFGPKNAPGPYRLGTNSQDNKTA